MLSKRLSTYPATVLNMGTGRNAIGPVIVITLPKCACGMCCCRRVNVSTMITRELTTAIALNHNSSYGDRTIMRREHR